MTKYHEQVPEKYVEAFVVCLLESDIKGQFLKSSNGKLLKDASLRLMEVFLDEDFEEFPVELKKFIVANNQSYANFPEEFFSDEEIRMLTLLSDINDLATSVDILKLIERGKNVNS